MDNIILETKRLVLRQMEQSDFVSLCGMLKDDKVMYAYEGAFDDRQVQEWLDRQLHRYEQYGFGLWAVILKETGTMIGQCGITMQDWMENKVMEVGYLFQRSFWHCGYAAEAAIACRDYAFQVLGAETVYSIIRDTNISSRRVAKRNGMHLAGELVKEYRGVRMPHLVFAVERGKTDE